MKRGILVLICLAVLVTAPACKKKEAKSETTVKRRHTRTIDNGSNGYKDKKKQTQKNKKTKKTKTTYERKSNNNGSTKKKQIITKEVSQPTSYDITTETMQR